MDTLTKLVRHSIWANKQLVDFLIAEQIDDPAVLRLVCHIGHGETAWFQRIYAQTVNPDIFRIVPLTELRALFAKHERFYDEQFCSDLSRIIAYRRFNGDEFQSSVSDILLHLCTHGSHHRGQVATLITKLGKTSPNVDYINYCRTKPV